MPTRFALAAALATISLAHAGHAAAQTDVLVVEGTSVGIPNHAPIGGSESISVSGARTRAAAGPAPARLDDGHPKGQNSPATAYQPYLKLELENTHSLPVRPAAPMLKAQPSQEQKYMEFKLKEVLISGVIANGNPAAPATDGHKTWIELQSWSYDQPQRPLAASGSRDPGRAAIAPKPKLETVAPRIAR
jgi:hypothetical protein